LKINLLKRLQSRDGFTMLEVAISMALTLFILQGIAMVSLYAQKSTIHARRVTSSTILAEQFMEQYRNMAYPNLEALEANPPGDVCFDKDMEELGACTEAAKIFTMARVFDANPVLSGGALNNVTTVQLTVSWEENWSWSAHQESGTQSTMIVSQISKF